MSNAALAVQPVAMALDIHPVAGRIGDEIRGITLAGGLDAATVEAILAQRLVRPVCPLGRDGLAPTESKVLE